MAWVEIFKIFLVMMSLWSKVGKRKAIFLEDEEALKNGAVKLTKKEE
jgi:hypothetical protein